MIIQINTDKNIKGDNRTETYFSEELEKAFDHFKDRISRMEVHFTDENGDKFGTKDKKCTIEARIEKLQPIAVTEHDETIIQAFNGAVGKLNKVLISTFEKMRNY